MFNETQNKTNTKIHAENSQNYAFQSIHNEVLKSLRLQKGWSIQDLASQARMERALVSKIEHYKVEPTLKDMIRIAIALGVDSRIIFPDRKSKWWEKMKQEALEKTRRKEEKQEEVIGPAVANGYY